ncbi:ChaN family lipoprotein [Terasakiella sp. A23]|uniref:ChaN family lipoprotein n=1 Tax=Terasakiella sp. FCG-A23 TaxID=3080561 RepID=UPI00295342D1|nr:ChaN family lipoprotein [Terasakiella sp. A23]MDV7341679.1 ChaN family lipoprotein [Terasakiella sp. A23]
MSLKSCSLITTALTLAFLSTAYAMPTEKTEKEPNLSCIQRAQWIAPKTLQHLDSQMVIKKAAQEKVVLLGEQHPDAVHHRWQLQTITQIYTHNPNIIIGFEMFPRRVQPALDAWVRGELSETEFLRNTDWNDVWKHDADIYMPLFRFARMNRIPIVALNVDMSLIGEVSQKGWDGVNDDKKEGVATPRPAHPDYLTSLKEVFERHSHVSDDEKKSDERFKRFVDSQLTWDGAMAQEIARVQKLGGEPLVIGVMGSGHIAHGHGVPHQLEGLGLHAKTLLPWTLGWDCDDLKPTYADAIFGLEEMEEKPQGHKPLLGVRIDEAEDKSGVLVEQVIEESVAEDAGLKTGDIIVSAAGVITKTPGELVTVIHRQAPGTWLPLQIKRDGDLIDILAKFPKSPH